MNAPRSPAGFFAASTRAIRREGVAGKRIAATMREGRLAIVGEGGGGIWVDPAEITRMQVGYVDSKVGRLYQTRLWRTCGRPPLTLHPLDRDYSYADTIRLLAATLAGVCGIGRVERGLSGFSAWLGPALMGLLVLAGIAVGLFALTEESWWLRFLPTLAPLVIFAALTWNAVARTAPKPIGDLAELDNQLP